MGAGSTSDIAARLPWPLAQLYARARGADPGRPPSAAAFWLFEAYAKLSAAALLGEYAASVAVGGPRVDAVDAAARALGRPDSGDERTAPGGAWLAVLRASGTVGQRRWNLPLDRSPALSALHRQLRRPTDESPEVLGSLLGLLSALLPRRRAALALAPEPERAAFDRDVRPLLLPAADELLAGGTIDAFGPHGTRLGYVVDASIDPADPGRTRALVRPLHGLTDAPVDEYVDLSVAPRTVGAGSVILVRPDDPVPVRLDPLVRFDNLRLTPDVLFLDGGRRYLCYATGRTEEADEFEATGPLAALLAPTPASTGAPSPRPDTTPPTELIPPRPSPRRSSGSVVPAEPAAPPESMAPRAGTGTADELPTLASLLAGGPVSQAASGGPRPPAAGPSRGPSSANVPAAATAAATSSDAPPPGTRLGPADPPPARPPAGSSVPSVSRAASTPSRPGNRRNTSAAPRRAVPALKLRAGETIHGGRFTVLSFQGGGGMGEVYRARDNTTGEDVALKFLPRERTADPVWLDQLKSEVRSAHRVRSPYVCAVHDIYVPHERHEGTAVPPFISMEFVDGEDLDRQLHRVGGLNVNTVVRLAHELAQGLRAVHKAGLLHRDLKPSNVMLDVNGEVRILDFGIAAPAEGEGDTAVAGTLAYMAPEVRRGERPASEASDLYAVGLILLELLTGGRAEAGSRTDAMLRNGTADDSVFGRAREQVPPKLRAAILGCLRPNPDERFQTAQAFEDALPAESARSLRRAEAIGAIAGSDALAPLSPRLLGLAVAAILLGAMGHVLLQPRFSPTARAKVTADVSDLRERAEQTAALMAKPWGASRLSDTDQEWGFGPNRDLLQSPNGGSMETPTAVFWFRSGPRSLEPFNGVTGVTDIDPPGVPGATLVRLGPAGEFLSASRRPADREAGPSAASPPSPPKPADVVALISTATGKPPPDGPVAVRPEPTWRSVWPDGGPVPTWTVLVGAHPYTAATVGPALVYLKRDDPAPAPVVEENADLREALSAVNFWWTALATLVGLALARRNVRLGRCNVGTATRLALLVLAAGVVGWVLVTHPQVTGRGALPRWTAGVGAALFAAGQAWVFCAAVDPYARLTWKRCLIGYARLTTDWPASLRDPLVGRSLLVGLGFGLAMSVMLRAADLLNDSPAAPYTALLREQLSLRAWGSPLRSTGLLVGAVAIALRYTLQQLVVIVLMYWVTRSRGLALALFVVANAAQMMVLRSDYSTSAAAAMAVFSALTATLIVREGILASAVGMFVVVALMQLPLSLDPAAWNFGFSLGVIALFAMLAGVGLLAALPEGGWRHLAALLRDPIDPAADARAEE